MIGKGKAVAAMTIRKRLFISNLLMILVPVCIAALIAAGCVGAVWYTVRFGGGLGFDDSEDFYQVSTGIAKLAEQSLPDSNEQETLDSITALLDRKAVSLKIEQDGQPYYAYGTASPADDALSKAAALLGDDARLSDGARSLYAHRVQIGGTDYRILIFGSTQQVSYTGLKLVAAAAMLLVLAAALAAVLLTNRFLTRFVFRRIEQPLALLADGVHQIRDGNLDFRITYDGKDEFAPVCADFNEMAERLRRSIEQTLRQEESRKELMASISHDLRSPLTSIKAYVEGLLDGVARTPEMQRRYLGTIKSKAEDIDRMVSQIFLFSKMELEEYPVHPEPLRLDEEVDSLMQSAAPEYRARGLEITVQPAPVTVCADRDLLRRILLNIMDNSLKYKNKPVGHLEITMQASGGVCTLGLTDDGPGVPEEACGKLFDVFYRSDPARRNPAGGSGLGLAIAATAAARMGGSIRAQNAQGGGLSIIITLPEEGNHAAYSDH